MGIVNVTPDSFSDGGRFLDASAAVAHAVQLVEQGAGIIDIGGESSRPGALPVDEPEELRRVMPVIVQLAGRIKVPISIDTAKAGEARAGYVCMHALGTPQTMQAAPAYTDVVREVREFFSERIQRLSDCGVSRD